MKENPHLIRIYSEHDLEFGASRFSLTYWRTQSTETILKSLLPGTIEALRVNSDGRIMNGNTCVKLLEEQGFDIDSLPREVL